MGTMKIRTPIAKSTKSLWNMSLLWKLFTIIVILQACGINAKVSLKKFNFIFFHFYIQMQKITLMSQYENLDCN